MKEFATEGIQKKLVILLDSLDQLLPAYGAHLLHWLPLMLPPHVRVIVSVLIPSSSQSPSVDSSMNLVQQLYTLAYGNLNEFTLEAMGEEAAGEVLRQILASKHRIVTEAQKDIVMSAFKAAPTPLYLQVASTFALTWNSWTPTDRCTLEQGMRGIINQVFLRLYFVIVWNLRIHYLFRYLQS